MDTFSHAPFRNQYSIGRDGDLKELLGGNSAHDWASLIPQYYQDYLGRAGSQEEIDNWIQAASKQKLTPDQVINSFKTSPEAQQWWASQQPPPIVQNRAQQADPAYIEQMLGPASSGWQSAARMQTAGMNLMPGVFFDYGNPGLATGQLADPASQGNLLIHSLLGQVPKLFDTVGKDQTKGLLGNLGSEKSRKGK